MVMTVDIPEQIVRDAEVNGLTVEQQLQRLAQSTREPDLTGLIPLNPGPREPVRAAASIREIAL